MRSLFLKIFLWFWVAMTLVVGVFITLVTTTREDPPRPERRFDTRRFRDMTSDALMVFVQSAAQTVEQNGTGALPAYYKRLKKNGRTRSFLFDENGAPLIDEPPVYRENDPLREINETELKKLVARARQSGRAEIVHTGAVVLAAQRATATANGQANGQQRNYVVAGAMRGIGFGFRPPSPDANRTQGNATDNRATGSAANSNRAEDNRAEGNRSDGDRNRRGAPSPWRFWAWWLFAQPSTQVLRLMVIFSITGFVCYMLVRHLTSPILQLRAATQRVAAGDLSTRVGTKLSKRRDELGMLGHDFDLMTERLESLMNAQKRLIADISHELRSPLARMNVALDLVRDTAGEEATEDLDRIELEAERLNIMIGQLLTLSRLESGEQMADTTPVDLKRVVEEVASDADFEAQSRNCEVKVFSSDHCSICGTEPLLRSAIENVVRNAVRYTAENTTVEIRLDCDSGAHNANPTAIIRVRDHGPGVPEESLSNIFRPFYRIADARDRQSGGTGLGLAITDRAVRLHHGTVEASNAPDGGLIVELRLPLQRKADTKA